MKRCSIATVFSLQAQIFLEFATDPSLFGEFSGGSATTSLRSVLCDEGKLAKKNRWALWSSPRFSLLGSFGGSRVDRSLVVVKVRAFPAGHR